MATDLIATPSAHVVADAMSFETIEALELALLESGQCFDLPAEHVFQDGIYLRTIRVPAGCILTGHEHRDRHTVLLVKGDITVWAKGEPHQRLQAPAMFTVEAGSRRVGLTHADTVWTTVHLTALTDAETWEDTCLVPHAFFPIPSKMPKLLPVVDEALCLP